MQNYRIDNPNWGPPPSGFDLSLGKTAIDLLKLAEDEIPFAPGVIIPKHAISTLPPTTIKAILREEIQRIHARINLVLPTPVSHPLLRITLLPDLLTSSKITIETVGLSQDTLSGLTQTVGENKSKSLAREYIEWFIPPTDRTLQRNKRIHPSHLNQPTDIRGTADKHSSLDELPDLLEQALFVTRKLVEEYNSDPVTFDVPAAIWIQISPLCYDPREILVVSMRTSELINRQWQDKTEFNIEPATRNRIKSMANQIEKLVLNNMKLTLSVWSGDFRIIDVQAPKKLLLAEKLAIASRFFQQNEISTEAYLAIIRPEQLKGFFLPALDLESVSTYTRISGGIAGSVGTATGAAFFSSEQLIQYFRIKKGLGETKKAILVKQSTRIEDYEAIRLCDGLITREGGFTSHAAIVARYLGKPSLILPDMRFYADHVVINGEKINDGSDITIDVSHQNFPTLYLGKGSITPSRNTSADLRIFLDTTSDVNKRISILANADSPSEIQHAIELGAEGIGLCRTEHMFNTKERFGLLQESLLLTNKMKKNGALSAIFRFLFEDFVTIFKLTQGKRITIRLPDIHSDEFLPDSDVETSKLIQTLAPTSKSEFHSITQRMARLKETNPMLGSRGCRMAFINPDLYTTVISAIGEAFFDAAKEPHCQPELDILVPFIMNQRELELVKEGLLVKAVEFKGIQPILAEKQKETGSISESAKINIGVMAEVPAAALASRELAKQSEIIAFGTNDLIQTTLGISRDDLYKILPRYTELDIWDSDPFLTLPPEVKDLIAYANRSAKEIRPDIKTGICGESSASKDSIQFCLKEGIDYISCAPGDVPAAKLTAARLIMGMYS